MCMCACVRVRACVRACVCVCVQHCLASLCLPLPTLHPLTHHYPFWTGEKIMEKKRLLACCLCFDFRLKTASRLESEVV